SATSETPRAARKKRRAASSPPSSRSLTSTGSTAFCTAPSPSSWRSTFGIVNATKNASVAARENTAAIVWSRTSPSARLASVPSATMPACLAMRRRSPASALAELGAASFTVPSYHRGGSAGASLEPGVRLQDPFDERERAIGVVGLERDLAGRALLAAAHAAFEVETPAERREDAEPGGRQGSTRRNGFFPRGKPI